MAYAQIKVEHHDKVGIITLNAPEVLNALSSDMVAELSQALDEVLASDARCLLLTGEGRGFCAGANLQTRGKEGGPTPVGSVLETHYHPILNRIRQMDIPMVAAVNGPAVGVGMSFAVIADIVVAAKSAYFLQAFARIGLVPDGGATYYLPRMIGWSRALELSLLAEKLPAEKAEDWGLVNRVVDDADLMPEALAIATKLANGPYSLGLIRKAYWESQRNSYEGQLQLEADLQRQAGSSKDNQEGVLAFLEKRDAKFTGE
ncbi:MAG: 2-(1,2-epoxy-1,2-dihydrophenyl)acetyl-CoA isomerase [Gammaproteobacteria bacterium]|nr:2-(1,2-epoxy-1,2-dihydrophenyl)acetyl-CoA isomerase [Gammaproteobacteria bacterium]